MGPSVTVADYGMGNLLSVCRALEHLGARVELSADPAVVGRASRLILPGVGAFGDGMHELAARGLSDVLCERAQAGVPLLGICLGAQMLLESSEEFGQHRGLGLVAGEVKALPAEGVDGHPLKVPHMGWEDLHVARPAPLLQGIPPGTAVYFVHSFECRPAAEEDLFAFCLRGERRVAAVVGHANVIGCQFHPEKSGPPGLRILHNFLEWGGES